MLKLIYINNTFDVKKDREVKEVEWQGKSVSCYLPPFANPVVYVNQKRITDFSIIPPNNAEVIFSPKQEITGISSWILSSIITTIGGSGGLIATVGEYYSLVALSYVAAGAVVMAGSMLLSSVLTPQVPHNNLQTADESPTYSWAPSRTLPRTGSPIPVLYGRHRLSGNIIQRKIDYVGDDEYLNLQLALCMGEIKEIHDGNILINNTPITDYEDVEWFYRTGAKTQTIMPYFEELETPNSFSVDIGATPILRETIGNANEAIRLFIQFAGGLYYQNNSGGLDKRTVEIKVEYRVKGDTTWTLLQQQDSRFDHWEYENRETLVGEHTSCNMFGTNTWDTTKTECWTGNKRAVNTTSLFNTWEFTAAQTTSFSREIRIPDLTPEQYEVQITRITAVSTDTREQTKCNWAGMGEIITGDLTYPTVALLGLRIKATGQLSGEVTVLTDVEREEIEVFNEAGVSQGLKRLDNPAWVFWDILTNPLYAYGLAYDRILFDDIEEWATWCDELVSAQLENWKEPRYRFDGVFDTESNIWDSLVKVATVGRASPIIRGTKYSVIVDKPTTMTQTFNMGNIVKSSLKISYISQEDLANEVEIQFTNKDKDYTNDTMSVVVPEWFSSDLQTKKTTIHQIGITRATQAYRIGRYFLNNNRNTRRIAEFDVGLDALDSEVGDVFGLSHDVPAWGQSGRIVNATANTVTLDRDIYINSGETYTLVIRYNDNTFNNTSIDDTNLTKAKVGTTKFKDWKITFKEAGKIRTLTLTTPFTRIPNKYDVYSIVEETKGLNLFRISSITRKDDFTRSIKAIEYNEQVVSDEPTVYPEPSHSELILNPKVTNITFDEHLEKRADGTIVPFIDFSLTSDTIVQGVEYNIYLSKDGGNSYSEIGKDIKAKTYSFMSMTLAENKQYFFKATVKTILGGYGSVENATPFTYTFLGKQAPPSDVSTFNATIVNKVILLTWEAVSDVDLAGYQLTVNGNIYNEGLTGTSFAYTPTTTSYTFGLKAIDTSGILSVNAITTSIEVSKPIITRYYAEVIDNNVLLRWEATQGSLPIATYNVYKGDVFSTSVFIGSKNGTFTAIFERAGGNFTYWVEAVDTAGQKSIAKSLVASVSQPPDYVLNADWDSDFSGAKTNVLLEGDLLTTVNVTETWEQHFTNNSKNTFQDFIDNGDTYYLQPTPATGTYQETFDYGAILSATQITVSPSLVQISGQVNYTIDIETSPDNSAWTMYSDTSNIYATNFRYTRITLNFTTTNGLAKVEKLNVTLDSKIKNDGGMATANSGDTNGTVVSFNTSFVDITSITVTPKGTSLLTAVYDFVDVPNPTEFKVYLFDNNGTRTSGDVSWNVKGY